MIQSIRASVIMLLSLSVLLGLIYPGLVTALAQAFMRPQAEGSLIASPDGKSVSGSILIGQSFSDPKYFWGRLSATGPVPYNAAISSGSNLGAAAPNLEVAIKARIEALKADQSVNQSVNQSGHTQPIPVDLVTASGSGLDPHISPEAAKYQIDRIAKARNLTFKQIEDLVQKHIERRQFGILGEPRVNILLLNKALDEAHGK